MHRNSEIYLLFIYCIHKVHAECINKWQIEARRETECTMVSGNSEFRSDDFMLKCHIHAKCITPMSVRACGWFSSCKIFNLYVCYRCRCRSIICFFLHLSRSLAYSHSFSLAVVAAAFVVFCTEIHFCITISRRCCHRHRNLCSYSIRHKIENALLFTLCSLYGTKYTHTHTKHFLYGIFRRK